MSDQRADNDVPTVKQCGWCSGFGHTTDEHNSVRPDDPRPSAEKDALIEAVKDVCWRAQRYGATEDGGRA
jgi:hypothetical protein